MKKWLINNFLPMWAKETVLADNKRLMKLNKKLEQENRELKIYIKGTEYGRRDMLALLRTDRGEQTEA